MQMTAKRAYEKPVLTRSRVLLQSVVAQSGSPAPTTEPEEDEQEEELQQP